MTELRQIVSDQDWIDRCVELGQSKAVKPKSQAKREAEDTERAALFS